MGNDIGPPHIGTEYNANIWGFYSILYKKISYSLLESPHTHMARSKASDHPSPVGCERQCADTRRTDTLLVQ
eukprot:m.1602506 g.1602506  ORF g.1602506 m.1602506 type:complete len:72 (+) comp25353_c0_seq60:71-286(+)